MNARRSEWNTFRLSVIPHTLRAWRPTTSTTSSQWPTGWRLQVGEQPDRACFALARHVVKEAETEKFRMERHAALRPACLHPLAVPRFDGDEVRTILAAYVVGPKLPKFL